MFQLTAIVSSSLLGSLALTGQPCEPIGLAAVQTRITSTTGTVQFECIDGQSRLILLRGDGQVFQRTVSLRPGDAEANEALLAVLIDEAMAIPVRTKPRPLGEQLRSLEIALGPSVWWGLVNTGIMAGADLRGRGRLFGDWLVWLLGLSSGFWSEVVPEGQLSVQRIELIAGSALTRRWGRSELALGALLRGGVLMGQGRASSVDFEARSDVRGFVGVAAHTSVALTAGAWAFRLSIEPGVSLSGAVVTAGALRRGPATGWVVCSVTVGYRW